jgi:hypothetical protein
MIILFFGFSLSTPFFVFGGLAFMTAAVSMLVYAALTCILPVRGFIRGPLYPPGQVKKALSTN